MAFFAVRRRAVLVVAGALAGLSGCEVISGIDRRELVPSAGGAAATSSGETSSAASGVGGGLGGSGGGGTCNSFACDRHNCGAPGHDCLGGLCVSGVCQPFVVASPVGSPAGLAADTSSIYFASTFGNEVDRCPLAGCGLQAPEPLVQGQFAVTWIELAQGSLWFLTSSNVGFVGRCSPVSPDCLPEMITQPTVSFGTQVVVDTATLYVGSLDGVSRCDVGVSCASPTMLDFGQVTALVDDGLHLYWISGSELRTCTKAQCSPTAVLPAGELVDGTKLEVRGRYLYFSPAAAGPLAGGLARCDLTSLPCSPTQVVSAGLLVRAFAIDRQGPEGQETLYYSVSAGSDDMSVYAKSQDPMASPRVLATHQIDPAHFLVTDSAVYWSDSGGGMPLSGAVMGMAK